MLVGSYNLTLVFLSLGVAVISAYTALDMAGRISAARGRVAGLWLLGGSIAMGMGIWSMHFVGMLAFSLPIPLGYDLILTWLSMLMAVVSSAFSLWLVSRQELPRRYLCGGALLMGSGIAGMHYTGMAALRIFPGIEYDPLWFGLSVIIAVLASGVALWIAFRLRNESRNLLARRLAAAVVMGCAIVGMHYTGMAAARFPAGSYCLAANSGLNVQWLAVLVVIITLGVMAIALIVSVLDTRFEHHTAGLAASLREANSELMQLALYDSLTRLPNRALLRDRLADAVRAAASRNQQQFAVLFMDLDGFKSVNDAYGHSAGDQLLVEVASRIRSCVQRGDTVARLGGDEFVVVMLACTPDDVARFAKQLIDVVSQPCAVMGHEVQVSASIGIAIYPNDGVTGEQILTNADTAMYRAKEQGRNGYCFFRKSMSQDALAFLQLRHDLYHAVERNQLVLHFQPKFRAPGGPVTGCEALLRWQHPERGMVSPDDFLPMAEKTGLIIPIGAWVLDQACSQMRQWLEQGHRDWSVAVNISAVQFAHPDLAGLVRQTLDRHALDPRHLILEITESTAMHDAEASLVILDRLVAMGVRISIDDFGTGYSSLMYLKRLPASELKIDREFVRDLARDSNDAAIISAIIALGRVLGLNIVAEGVENTEQQQFLTRLGCDALQGYLLGRPMTAEQMSALGHSGLAPGVQ